LAVLLDLSNQANPKDARGFDIHEAQMNAAWLLQHGVPHHMILEESTSMETVGNALFARVMHTDVLSLKHIAVINNGWHMPRTMHVFSHVFGVPSGRECAHERAHMTVLTFVECASGLEPTIELQRLAREKASISKFAPGGKWQTDTATLELLHLWLHRENMAYSVQRIGREAFEPSIDPAVAKSY